MLPRDVDVVALTVFDDVLNVLRVTHHIEPFRGRPALPDGIVLPGEDLAAAAGRVGPSSQWGSWRAGSTRRSGDRANEATCNRAVGAG